MRGCKPIRNPPRFRGKPSRARPNTVRAYAHDLKTFFTVVVKDPLDVRAKDMFGFITAQQQARVGAENVARISDGGSGLVGGDGAPATGGGVGVLSCTEAAALVGLDQRSTAVIGRLSCCFRGSSMPAVGDACSGSSLGRSAVMW